MATRTKPIPLWYRNARPEQRVLYVWRQHFGRSGLTAHCIASLIERPVLMVVQHLLNTPGASVHMCGVVQAPVWSVERSPRRGYKDLTTVERQLTLLRKHPRAVGFRAGRPITTTDLSTKEVEVLRAAAAGTFFPAR